MISLYIRRTASAPHTFLDSGCGDVLAAIQGHLSCSAKMVFHKLLMGAILLSAPVCSLGQITGASSGNRWTQSVLKHGGQRRGLTSSDTVPSSPPARGVRALLSEDRGSAQCNEFCCPADKPECECGGCTKVHPMLSGMDPSCVSGTPTCCENPENVCANPKVGTDAIAS